MMGKRKLIGRALARRAIATTIGIGAALAMIAWSSGIAMALDESPAASGTVPDYSAPPTPPSETMKVVPSEEGETGAPKTAPVKKHRIHRRAKAATPPEVEPETGRLRVIHDGWIYAAPSKSAKKIERATIGKFVNVTGSTKYYLQVQLKDGQTGYIAPTDVELVKPVDKIFILTQDAPVLDAPNRFAKKIAEVHKTHSVHVIGLALNYMQIRMKNGLVGFIPATALQ
jgi:hypothetical protein